MCGCEYINLSSGPAEHLASLVSCVTGLLHIRNISGCGLGPILDSVQSEWLVIFGQSLGSEETRALVRAIESGVAVEIVELSGELTLDIKAMIEYSGQGKCREVWCYIDIGVFKEDLRTWAQSRNWKWQVISNLRGLRLYA